MKVLVACEFSGVVRNAFANLGHEAWSCDLLPTEIPGNHYQGNVRDILYSQKWDLLIGHPPCTYLANSGVQHLHKRKDRWELMLLAKEFFLLLLDSPIEKICIENPVPHHYANLPKYTQIIQPYMFGHTCQKKTCLWLKNLPNLQPTNIVDKGKNYIGRDGKSNGSEWYQLLTSGKDRWKKEAERLMALLKQWLYNGLVLLSRYIKESLSSMIPCTDYNKQ